MKITTTKKELKEFLLEELDIDNTPTYDNINLNNNNFENVVKFIDKYGMHDFLQSLLLISLKLNCETANREIDNTLDLISSDMQKHTK